MARARRAAIRPSLRIVFASAELAPLAQTGGLGDAVAGLAAALARRGHSLSVLVPGWRSAFANGVLGGLRDAGVASVAVPGRSLSGRWRAAKLGEVEVELLDCPELFHVPEPYAGADTGLRFVAFSRAVAARCLELRPHAFVAHDWHAALSICAFQTLFGFGAGRGVGSVQVVHNGAHIGRFPAWLYPATGLPGELFSPDGLEFHGDLCLLKGGLAWADRIVAVSPSYAAELETPEHGFGLEGLYRHRSRHRIGIANGIDTARFDPAADPALAASFDARKPAGRSRCRSALIAELGLTTPAPGRLLAAVGRLAHQKGWDYIAEAAGPLVTKGFCLALLGNGDLEIARQLRGLVQRYPQRVAFVDGWDDALSRRFFAGADAILVPSRFEPCGLVQLRAQRYGALPVAHAVGGLCDTIRDGETGVLFSPLSAAALIEAAERGAAMLAAPRGSEKIRELLALDVSWDKPAEEWERVLVAVAGEAAARV
jgi:starch synthase